MERSASPRVAQAVLLVLLLGGLWVSQRAIDGSPERKEATAERPLVGLSADQVVTDYVGVLFLGGFRALVVDALWQRAQALDEQQQYYEMLATTALIVRLQSHYAKVWREQAYNMAYNISWQQEDREQRWQWIQRALDLLEDARRRNPKAVLLSEQTALIYFHRIPFEEYLKRRVRQTDPQHRECHELAEEWYATKRSMAMAEGAAKGRPLDYLVNDAGAIVESRYELGLTRLGLAVAAARAGKATEARSLLAKAEKALLSASQESSYIATYAGDPTFWRNRAMLYREVARSRTVLAPCLLDTTRAWVERILAAPLAADAKWPEEVLASAWRVVQRWQELSTYPVQYFVMQGVLDSATDAFSLWDAGNAAGAKALLEARAAFCESFNPADYGWKEFAIGLRSLEAALAKEQAGSVAGPGAAIAREEARRIYRLFIDRSLRLDVDRLRERMDRLPR